MKVVGGAIIGFVFGLVIANVVRVFVHVPGFAPLILIFCMVAGAILLNHFWDKIPKPPGDDKPGYG